MLQAFPGTLVTTEAVLTEAFYLLEKPAQQAGLWGFISAGALRLECCLPADLLRMRRLMAKYADLPMDFADASLVAVAERMDLRLILTLDHHFGLYRPRHTRSFEVLP